MGPNQYRFTLTFLDREALRIFDLKSTELPHENVVNLNIVMNHVVAFFDTKECLSKQKRYIRYKTEKPYKITMRQYVGLIRNLYARMAQMPPHFQENQHLDKSELIDSLANKSPRSHKAILISQGFIPQTIYLETFVDHCERAETTDSIAMARFSVSDKDSDTKREKKRPRFKEQDEHGKKRHKTHYLLYCSLYGENNATPPGIAKSSRKKLKTSLSIPQRTTRGSPGK